ncbi:MAG: hypothetical protein LBB98_06850 [Treponema sp.]|jgi:hypothetical protein|nr:hypothetical protein [Treponema sp.]
MKNRQRTWLISDLKGLICYYREDGYIDEDCLFRVRYNDGSILTYPDWADQIKFKNIQNIWYQTADDSGDFTHDFIGTRETYDFVFGVIYKWNPFFLPENPLILEEEDDYGRTFEKNGKPVIGRGAA